MHKIGTFSKILFSVFLSLLYFFIHSFCKYLLSIYYLLYTLLEYILSDKNNLGFHKTLRGKTGEWIDKTPKKILKTNDLSKLNSQGSSAWPWKDWISEGQRVFSALNLVPDTANSTGVFK